MTRQPQLLHVINDLDYWLLHREPIARGALARGYSVTVAAPNNGSAKRKVEALGYKFFELQISRFGLSINDFCVFRKLRKFLLDESFDVVHLMTIKPLLLGGLVVRTLPSHLRSRIVGTVAGLGRAFNYTGLRFSLIILGLRYGLGKMASIVTFENPSDRSAYLNYKILTYEQTAVLNGAGVDLDVYSPKQSEHAEVCVFLFVGRMLRSKGILEFATAAEKMKHNYGNQVAFRIAGISALGEPDGLTASEVEQLQTASHIEWLGRVDQSKMPSVMQSSDVLVLPTVYQEGMPRVCIEAGACALAVIAGDVAGTRYLIEHLKNGILISDNISDELVNAMAFLLVNPDVRKRLGVALREKLITQGFSTEDIVKKFLRFYKA